MRVVIDFKVKAIDVSDDILNVVEIALQDADIIDMMTDAQIIVKEA